MFFKTFIFILGVAFVLANPIQEEANTGDNFIEIDESNNPTSTQKINVEEVETEEAKLGVATESYIEEPVKDPEEEEKEVQESVVENSTPSTSTVQLTEQASEVPTEQVSEAPTEQSSEAPTEQASEATTEQVSEASTEPPKKDLSIGEKIAKWFKELNQKMKEDWEALKNKISHIIH